jgi:hypothetical protein
LGWSVLHFHLRLRPSLPTSALAMVLVLVLMLALALVCFEMFQARPRLPTHLRRLLFPPPDPHARNQNPVQKVNLARCLHARSSLKAAGG